LLVLFLAGIAQLGTVFAARAGLQQAVSAGARLATIYPRPSDATIIAKVQTAAFALKSSQLDTPTVTHGTANGLSYIDISATYHPQLNFVFFTGPTITLTKTRRAYVN
jgi:Flp pilus assembly protein TadG